MWVLGGVRVCGCAVVVLGLCWGCAGAMLSCS